MLRLTSLKKSLTRPAIRINESTFTRFFQRSTQFTSFHNTYAYTHIHRHWYTVAERGTRCSANFCETRCADPVAARPLLGGVQTQPSGPNKLARESKYGRQKYGRAETFNAKQVKSVGKSIALNKNGPSRSAVTRGNGQLVHRFYTTFMFTLRPE